MYVPPRGRRLFSMASIKTPMRNWGLRFFSALNSTVPSISLSLSMRALFTMSSNPLSWYIAKIRASLQTLIEFNDRTVSCTHSRFKCSIPCLLVQWRNVQGGWVQRSRVFCQAECRLHRDENNVEQPFRKYKTDRPWFLWSEMFVAIIWFLVSEIREKLTQCCYILGTTQKRKFAGKSASHKPIGNAKRNGTLWYIEMGNFFFETNFLRKYLKQNLSEFS